MRCARWALLAIALAACGGKSQRPRSAVVPVPTVAVRARMARAPARRPSKSQPQIAAGNMPTALRTVILPSTPGGTGNVR